MSLSRLKLTVATLIAATCAVIVFNLSMVVPQVVEAQSSKDPVLCTQSVAVSGASAATAELVAVAANKRVYVCGFVVNGAGATTVTFKTGTGTTCGTNTASLTGAMKLIDGSGIAYAGGPGYVMKGPVGHALCWTNSATIQVSGVVSYAQF